MGQGESFSAVNWALFSTILWPQFVRRPFVGGGYILALAVWSSLWLAGSSRDVSRGMLALNDLEYFSQNWGKVSLE
jgi:hypothetical protein